MNKIVLTLLSFCLCSTALAENEFFTCQPYAKMQLGTNLAQTISHRGIKPSFHSGYFLSGACGYQWRYGLQTECEYAFRRNTMSKIHYYGQDFRIPGAFQSSSFMTNLMWECSLGEYFLCGFQPYLGVGIGLDIQKFHAHQEDFHLGKSKRGFAWQAMTGFSYPMYEGSEIAVEYKYHKGPSRTIFCHAINITFTYKFFCKRNEQRVLI